LPHKTKSTLEHTLEEDLHTLENYFKKWQLKSNPSKTVVSAFHLNNRLANQKLIINFCSQPARYGSILIYLIVFGSHSDKILLELKESVNFMSGQFDNFNLKLQDIIKTVNNVRKENRELKEENQKLKN